MGERGRERGRGKTVRQSESSQSTVRVVIGQYSTIRLCVYIAQYYLTIYVHHTLLSDCLYSNIVQNYQTICIYRTVTSDYLVNCIVFQPGHSKMDSNTAHFGPNSFSQASVAMAAVIVGQ